MKHNCPALIAPSLLSCDLARIADDAQNMLDLGADWLVRSCVLRIRFVYHEKPASVASATAHTHL